MISEKEIKEEIINIILRLEPDIDTDKLCSSKNFMNDSLLDSLSIINLIVEIEEKFNIEINDNDLIVKNIQSISGIIYMIKKQLSNNK